MASKRLEYAKREDEKEERHWRWQVQQARKKGDLVELADLLYMGEQLGYDVPEEENIQDYERKIGYETRKDIEDYER